MERYVAGDQFAFAVLYQQLAPRLCRYFLRRIRDRERTADLLQQTFLQIHRGRSGFLPGAEVRPWASAIARRLLIDHVRLARREAIPMEECDAPGADPKADELMAACQLATRLEGEVARLPMPQRVAFELRQRGLSLAEAAEELRISTGAVKLRIHRAHLALRLAIVEQEDPP